MVIPGYSTASFGGSVGGGERYDGMFERIVGKKIAGTGIAFGFDRTLEALEYMNLLPKFENSTKAMVTVFSPELLEVSIKTARSLRESGINTEIYPDENTRLDKQLKYADKKGVLYVVIIGSEEAEKNVVTLKNLKTKEQKKVTMDELCKILRE